MLSVLGRIKNVILRKSLQGGHRLIEIIFMLIVVVLLCFVAFFVFAAKHSELGAKEKAQLLCKKLTFRKSLERLYRRKDSELDFENSHYPLTTIRRLIQST